MNIKTILAYLYLCFTIPCINAGPSLSKKTVSEEVGYFDCLNCALELGFEQCSEHTIKGSFTDIYADGPGHLTILPTDGDPYVVILGQAHTEVDVTLWNDVLKINNRCYDRIGVPQDYMIFVRGLYKITVSGNVHITIGQEDGPELVLGHELEIVNDPVAGEQRRFISFKSRTNNECNELQPLLVGKPSLLFNSFTMKPQETSDPMIIRFLDVRTEIIEQ